MLAKGGDLSHVRAEVEHEMDTYVYEAPEGLIGQSFSAVAITDGIAQMRKAIVDPYWVSVELRDTFDQIGSDVSVMRECVAVADDGKGVLLLFDPSENSYVLAQAEDGKLSTFGVRGDAVGCFLAR